MKYTEPTLEHIEGFAVSGIDVRTINSDEFNQDTAKLPALWGNFFSKAIAEKIANRLPDSSIYGVYSAYESDATSFYTVTAGVAVENELKSSEFSTVNIKDGYYLVFSGKGMRPNVIVDTWKNIWTYFATNSKYTRSYLSDFERYNGSEDIAIYIGIQKPAEL